MFLCPDGNLNFVPFADLSGNGQNFVMADFHAKALATGKGWETLAEVQRDWFVKLRNEKGMLTAVRDAGPFAMALMVNPAKAGIEDKQGPLL